MAKKAKKNEIPEVKITPRDVDWRSRDGLKPTRTFEVGESVKFGNHPNAVILEVNEGGNTYLVHAFGSRPVYGVPTEYEQKSVVSWCHLYKIGEKSTTSLAAKPEFRMNQSQRSVEGLLSMVHRDYAGVDFAPEYQREYVWTLEDKQKLIDSIFNNVSIGLFVFANLPYEEDQKHYEIIDGKQRLTALVEFFEDRFQYKGYYFSQLSWHDQHHFEECGAHIGILEKPTVKEKYAAFLAVNTFGKVMDESHLKSVREVYESL